MAIIRKFRLRFPVAILEAMQYHLYPLGMKGFYLVEYDDYTAVISGVRDIKSDNMKEHSVMEK